MGGVLALVVVLFEGFDNHFLLLGLQAQGFFLRFVRNVFHPLGFLLVVGAILHVQVARVQDVVVAGALRAHGPAIRAFVRSYGHAVAAEQVTVLA